jgi:hypothetical protein
MEDESVREIMADESRRLAMTDSINYLVIVQPPILYSYLPTQSHEGPGSRYSLQCSKSKRKFTSGRNLPHHWHGVTAQYLVILVFPYLLTLP